MPEQAAPVTTSLDGEDLINYPDVTARIADLEAHDCGEPEREDYPCSNVYECATCDETAEEELAALRALEEEMRPASEYSGRASALRDSYLETYARQEVDDVCGSDAVSILDSYVKWDELTDDRRAEMTETTFLGTTYYITS